MKVKYHWLRFEAVVGTRNGKALWCVKCRCGNRKIVLATNVKSGKTKSCGCRVKAVLAARMTTHGMSGSPTYTSWYAMHQRCKSNTDYVGRVRVCKAWFDFSVFFRDMGERPLGHTIDRKDNNGDYCPGNCRWATRAEQNMNTRHNVMLTYRKRTQCASAWARELGMSPKTFRARRYRGWSLERMFNTPLGGVGDLQLLAAVVQGSNGGLLAEGLLCN